MRTVYSYCVVVWEVLERQRPHMGVDPLVLAAQYHLGDGVPAVALPPLRSPPAAASPREHSLLNGLAELTTACLDPEPAGARSAVLCQTA